ncbi:uncharacterized protein LOC114530986 [Dendronephthya gigantea]|uniref:uncharacterized protein LOC114530986 n=1 Tax=Dendronephthya gigantea TaxID=151771 RepID=UPI00106CF444|nr:uncharacterized protein LOC114530986 [Dendronephthya gigantea]
MDQLCERIFNNVVVDLNQIDGKAVLFFAAENDYGWVVRQLYFQGLDLNLTDDQGKTAVFYANENKSMDALCELIINGAKFNLNEIDGKAVLFFAAENDYRQIVEDLYFKGLDLNLTDDQGKTAVFYANENKSMDALCELIINGAKFNLNEIDGKAVLFFAAENDYRQIVEDLYFKDLDLNLTDDQGKTAVFYANENNSIGALCELISNHAKFNLNEIDGKAVLFFAAENDYRQIVADLYFKGLDLNLTDDQGKTAVFYANENKSMDALCELIINDAKFNLNEIDGKAVLFFAAENNYRQIVEDLYFKGLDLNLTDDQGKTAVFYANENKSMDALCELIINDAKFNLNEIDGKAVLFFAAENNYRQIVEDLYFKGLDLNLTDDQGKTAVFYANENKSMDALCELIINDAKFNLNEIDGKAVLFFAAENNYRQIVEDLYFKGLDLNLTDDQGKTAVFYANENKSMDALWELIINDAKFNLNEIDGKAVLFFAAENNYRQIVEDLYFKGLDLNLTDDQGKTAVFYANENNSMDTLCELIGHDAEFNLNEIDGKAVLFYASKNEKNDVVAPLHDAGLDLNITDDKGRTVVFNCDHDFLETLMSVDDAVVINARDSYGRTPLFCALQDFFLKEAQSLVENGGNLKLRDNCNVDIFFFFVENCFHKDIKALQLFTSELFKEEQQRKALILAIFDNIYCQIPLLSVDSSSHLSKLYKIFNKSNILEALAFARHQCPLIYNAEKVENIDLMASIMREENIDVPRILFLLSKLDANPNAADSAGNTAVHYAVILPLFGVTQEAVMDMLKYLKKFGASFNLRNHQNQTPLLFCLSSHNWKALALNKNRESSMKGLVKVFGFLLNNGCNITEISQNAESIFHRIIFLMKECLELNEDASRKVGSQVLFEIFMLISHPNQAVVFSVANSIDYQLNSPLHLWASVALKSQHDYANLVTEEHMFESFMRTLFDHLLKCGARLNLRNGNEQTPLHVSRTWIAVKLLLEAGANPNDMDASGRSPLLSAAIDKNCPRKTACFYPDITEDPEMFWENVLEKGLNFWVLDKKGVSLLSALIDSEEFALTRALVEVSCKKNYATDEVKLSFLNIIYKDRSEHTHWKTILVEIILSSTRTNDISLDSPLRFCCKNIIELGVLDVKPHSVQENANNGPSNDDGQPPPKKRKKSESSEEEEGKGDRLRSDSVHCKIVAQLLSRGADIHIHDSSGISCLDIAKDCLPLQNLLQKPVETDTLPIRIPWASTSDRFREKLAKVARQQECKILNQIWYHKDLIGSGSFGDIFAGINEKDGREVAVKRIVKLRMQRPEDRREIENLTALADCQQVVRYISCFVKGDFFFIVLELMEGNLEEYLSGCTLNAMKATTLCRDIVKGLKFLHKHNILHRDLKPGNILYKEHPKLCLKIADFGLSRNNERVSTTTVYGTLAGTRCWMAPEVVKNKIRHELASDIFSCGLLLHYILSKQKHPFSPTDCSNKSELQVSFETETNIFNDKLEGWDVSLSPEATHLVKRMLGSNEGDRPSAQEALEHPLFWSNGKKKDFLEAVGNQEEFKRSRAKRIPSLTLVETDLESSFGAIVKHGRWTSSQYTNMPQIYSEMTKGKWRKSYDTSSAVELVRFIRNVYEHSDGITLAPPVSITDLLFKDFVFLEDFPHLVMEVYKAVTAHGWDKARDDIKFAMNKE